MKKRLSLFGELLGLGCAEDPFEEFGRCSNQEEPSSMRDGVF